MHCLWHRKVCSAALNCTKDALTATNYFFCRSHAPKFVLGSALHVSAHTMLTLNSAIYSKMHNNDHNMISFIWCNSILYIKTNTVSGRIKSRSTKGPRMKIYESMLY